MRIGGKVPSMRTLRCTHAGLTLQFPIQVACGARHTVFRTACGKAFSTGWGKYGQLGLGDTGSRDAPDQLVPEKGIHDIACGWWSTMLLVE
jgi:alpha-tubulin suppressor-like RCC1 family protein